MKKRNIIAIFATLAAVLLIFTACKGKDNGDDVTNPTVIGADGQVYEEVTEVVSEIVSEVVTEIVTEVVTDGKGEAVTDKEGKTEVKTEVVTEIVTEVVTNVVTVTKPVETTTDKKDEGNKTEGTTGSDQTAAPEEGSTTFEDVTFPEGELIEVELNSDGKPVQSKMEKILHASAESKAFYLNCTVVTNQNLGIVETGVPMKLYMKDSKFAFEMKMGLATLRMAYDGKSMNVILPETKYYYSVAAGEEGEIVNESMNMWETIGSTSMEYVSTTNVRIKGTNYVCETYTDSTNTNKYYFDGKGNLKRIEIIATDGTTTILKVHECSSKVNDSIFSVPKGYKQLTEDALAGIVGNMGLM